MTGARMTRRDRVACMAALEQSRLWCPHKTRDEEQRDEYAENAVWQALATLDDVGSEALWDIGQNACTNRRNDRLVAPPRIIRARLALLLRALLRADGALDVAGPRRKWCKRRLRGEPCTCWNGRIVTAWELAPASRRT